MKTSRSLVMRGFIVLTLVIVAGWSYLDWQSAVARSESLQNELDRCVSRANRIHELNQNPRLASLAVESAAAMTQRAQSAVAAASMPVGNLASVEPGSPQRLQDSDYLLRPTRIELNRTSIEQLIRFCESLTGGSRRLTVRDIELKPAQSTDPLAELWVADITLTELVFSPTTR